MLNKIIDSLGLRSAVSSLDASYLRRVVRQNETPCGIARRLVFEVGVFLSGIGQILRVA
jgi:hypothetical protein